MLRLFARRAVATLPATPGRRYATAGVVALVGIGVSIMMWARATGERQAELTGTLGSLADNTTSAIEWQIDREVDGLRGLATVAQVHAPGQGDAWRFDASMLMDHFPGIQWIAWVTPDSTALPFVPRDTTVHVDPDLVRQARFQLNSAVSSVQDRWDHSYLLDVFLPVRQPLGASVLLGEVRVDSLWLKQHSMLGGNLSITLEGDHDHAVPLHTLPDRLAPSWMRLQRTLTSPSGSALLVRLSPSDDLVRQVATPWPRLFLVSGTILSIAVGVLLLQFLRLRDFASALERTNRHLDAQLVELSSRDRELQELNEDLERRVRERTTELSEALREVETFSHSVSHDLRSPIGAILNFSGVIAEDYGAALDQEGSRLLTRVRAAAGRASTLLDALGEFAASGASLGEPRMVDMGELARHAFAEAKGKDGQVDDVRFAPGALPPAWADPAHVHRMFVNLFDNALKFSRGRPVREVEVGGEADGTENTYWVRDNGHGFEPGRAAEVFEPFRRLHGAAVEGTGLGLAIVAKSVAHMGGRAWAESDGSNGATFFFTLPNPEERRDDAPADDPAGG